MERSSKPRRSSGQVWFERSGNRVSVRGRLSLDQVRNLLATIHNATARAGYTDLVLDFSNCTAAYPGAMLSLVAQIAKLRRGDLDTEIDLPTDIRLANLFRNSGWAHLLDPAKHQPALYRGFAHVPAIQLSSPAEQKLAVDRMIDAVLSSMPNLTRPDLGAIEWALNEITDNVLVHSQSPVGGFVQLNNLRKRRLVEFTVADPGLGIPSTIREGHSEIRSDTEALDRAIREGVTRDRKVGQGNGLFGTFEIAQVGNGYLHVHSGYARLDFEEQLHVRTEQIPVNGTVVVAALDVSKPDDLGEALKFEGERYETLSYVDVHFEGGDRDALVFRLKDEASSFGSRIAGAPVRVKLGNLVTMNPTRRIVVDLADVPLVSSSFADEVFGKLFLEIGALRFMRSVEFKGLASTVRDILDRAIMQRASEQ